MSETYELARELKAIEAKQTAFERDLSFHLEAAEALVDAGYTKQRTIGTFTELLEVKQGAVVIDKTGAVMQLKATDHEGPFGHWFIMGEPGSFPYSSVHLPATILREVQQ